MHDTPNAMQHSVSTLQVDADEVPPAAADSSPLLDPETESSNNPTPDSNEVHRRTGENQTIAWLLMTIPLILHFLSIVVLTVAIKFYISGHSFNLDSRRALTTFAPLQSDITTAISSGISILRIFTTMWTTSTAWRCAFILMENGGISLEQINRLLTWQIHFNSDPISSRKAQAGALISVILLAALPCQLSGPILTGSIIDYMDAVLWLHGRQTHIDPGKPHDTRLVGVQFQRPYISRAFRVVLWRLSKGRGISCSFSFLGLASARVVAGRRTSYKTCDF